MILRGGKWYLRDLDSRNGTWLDGTRVIADEPLTNGARIRFGAEGPEVEVRIGASGPDPGSGGAPETVSRWSGGTEGTPSDRIRALTHKNRSLTRTLVVAVLVVGTGLVAMGYAWTRRDAAYERERSELRARIDSLLEAGRSAVLALEGQMEGLATALSRSNEEVGRLRSALDSAESAGADASEVADLRIRLQAATVALTRQQLAASLDFPAIETANRGAVAVVYAELAPGMVSTATAFAVRPDGTLLTNRHVVEPEPGGARPTRIGVQFANSPQVWPGRVVTVSPETDLAVLRVDNVLGEVPTILGFNEAADTLAAGTPVALLGFPLGGDLTPERGGGLPRPLLTAGVLQGQEDGRLEILGYGEQGASGSPVFDGTGHLIGVLFGGRDDNSGLTLLAVPTRDVLRFLGVPGGGGSLSP